MYQGWWDREEAIFVKDMGFAVPSKDRGLSARGLGKGYFKWRNSMNTYVEAGKGISHLSRVAGFGKHLARRCSLEYQCKELKRV